MSIDNVLIQNAAQNSADPDSSNNGITITGSDVVTVQDSIIEQSGGNGIEITGPSSNITLTGNEANNSVTGHGFAIDTLDSGSYLSYNDAVGNGHDGFAIGTLELNASVNNNSAHGNQFSGFFTNNLKGTMNNNDASYNKIDGFHVNTLNNPSGQMQGNGATLNTEDGFDIGDAGVTWQVLTIPNPIPLLPPLEIINFAPGYFDVNLNSASGNATGQPDRPQ